MKNFTRKLSAIALCTALASMQIASAAIDTGLGAGNGGAVINNAQGGFTGVDKGNNSATLNFNGNSHVNWNTLNVNKGETLNFNAANGVKGITVVNTVNSGMSQIYGTINSNSGVGKLIISNPNGMLFDGAKFTTAGDLMLTTQALDVNLDENGNIGIKGLNQESVTDNAFQVQITNSDFAVGGEFNITAPSVEAIKSVIKASNGFKLITADGQNYLVAPTTSNDTQHVAVRLESVQVDGNVYIASGKDLVKIVNGGTINGNLDVQTDGNVSLNYVNNENKLVVNGNVNVDNDGRISYLRNADVKGNLTMANSGGFLEISDVNVTGDAKLTTTNKTNFGEKGVKHFIHVVGHTNVDGNMTINSVDNVHIGGYNSEKGVPTTLRKDGSLTVGKDLDVTARGGLEDGTIAVTVDTKVGGKVSLDAGLNIITDGDNTTITANEYQFKADHFIGGVNSEEKIVNIMENYVPLDNVKTAGNLTINGGNVTKIEAVQAFVKSRNDMNVNGIKAKEVYLTADQADIKIDKDNHADLITVGGETKNLTVELPSNSRDYTLKYTNIKDTEVITINPETEITYEMANGDKGWNKGTQTRDNTYLVVPGPQDPDIPTPPGPGPDDPDPKPPVNPDDNDNVKILNNLQRDQINAAVDANEVYTPIAFAADLDDEIDTGVRKNVDGSVTVVRPYTPTK